MMRNELVVEVARKLCAPNDPDILVKLGEPFRISVKQSTVYSCSGTEVPLFKLYMQDAEEIVALVEYRLR